MILVLTYDLPPAYAYTNISLVDSLLLSLVYSLGISYKHFLWQGATVQVYQLHQVLVALLFVVFVDGGEVQLSVQLLDLGHFGRVVDSVVLL